MKIVFICGSAQPGKDGVGDYVRLLASELILQGNDVVLLALNDAFVSEESKSTQYEEDVHISVIRLPRSLDWKTKGVKVNAFIKSFNPDWVSLQYVPYSFHKKGIPTGFASMLHEIKADVRWHIMFHEIWIGISTVSPFKHKIIGFFQRQVAKRIVKTLQPRLITVSNVLYQLVAESAGIKAKILPLFSNIRKSPPNLEYVKTVYQKLGVPEGQEDKWMLLGIFGTLYPQARLEDLLVDLVKNNPNKEIGFISFGRIGDYGINEIKRLEELFKGKINFVVLGLLSPAEVSTVMQLLSVAISCTPQQHIGKSGVYSALKYHNVKVEVPVNEYLPDYSDRIMPYYKEYVNKPAEEFGVKYIANKYIELLKTL
ncbi:hypothetical protein ACLI08_00305 [Flavobacterium sp. RNTU_13]|uniref:hypothetical protein n=1 Tax=Flavobacterium sp. RNTU_13 TaxID=3375145 RepID=UPI0039889B44